MMGFRKVKQDCMWEGLKDRERLCISMTLGIMTFPSRRIRQLLVHGVQDHADNHANTQLPGFLVVFSVHGTRRKWVAWEGIYFCADGTSNHSGIFLASSDKNSVIQGFQPS